MIERGRETWDTQTIANRIQRFGLFDLLAAVGQPARPLLTQSPTKTRQPASTAAIATAVASTFELFSPATQMRPERTM